jgi:asparagine synthase (glutamine-hydrolysing)
MLLGAYGRDASQRVEGAAGGSTGDHSDQVEVIHRGDLALAWQRSEAPAITESAGLLCVLEGEITAAPWRAATRGADRPYSPTEVLEAWHRLGENVVTDLRGSFVLVLWDQTRRSGLLVRDPTGLRPLVRTTIRGSIAFASEIRQLLAIMPTAPPPDPVALSFWLSNDVCWDERTFFEGITPLRAGHLIALGAGEAKERAWWRPSYSSPARVGLEDAAEAVGQAIERSIASQSRPEEAVGVLLSGGVDSTSVAAFARRALDGSAGQLTGYSATFPDHPQTDESKPIEAVCRQLKIPSVQMAVRGGSPIGGVLRFISEWGIPSHSVNCFFWPNMLERVRDDKTRLLLGGEGGDELFELSSPLLADRLLAGRPAAALKLARQVPGGQHQPLGPLVRLCLREAAASILPSALLQRLRRPSSAWAGEPVWLGPRLVELHRTASDPLRWRALDGPRWWAYRAYVLTAGRELVGFNDEIRRLYERPDIRVHQPLLDLNLVELVLGLPPELAYSPRMDRPVLRSAVRGLIPEQVRTRIGKSDFAPVLSTALADEDLAQASDLLLDPDARIREFVDIDLVRRQLFETLPREHPGGSARWAIDLWRIVSAECWLRAQEDPANITTLLSRLGKTQTSFHLALPTAET